jgi:hypothetical protein
MRHLVLGWRRDHRLVVEAEPIVACALAAASPPGAGPGLLVAPDLEVVARPHIVAAPRPERPDGLPGPSWPLEDDAGTATGSPEG